MIDWESAWRQELERVRRLEATNAELMAALEGEKQGEKHWLPPANNAARAVIAKAKGER